MTAEWRPAAAPDAVKLRATLLARIRAYFARCQVLEVDTPVLSMAGSTDPALHSFTTTWHGPGPRHGKTCYLHSSPEFPMKRLLAAGSGDIYQVCKVFRDNEAGALHNPEFTLLEWYRTGFDHLDLMDDVERLLTEILADVMPVTVVHHWTWRDLFVEFAAVDPFATSIDEISAMLEQQQLISPVGMQDVTLDAWLDLLLTHVIEPRLGKGLVFIRDYPASQAALARLRHGDPPVAARFEVYLNEIEIANGFHELADAAEQQQRFAAECERRERLGLAAVPVDQRLLAALQAGLPDCAGVALGLDRLLMVVSGADRLDAVIAFPFDIS
jgi:lysyl-tRNA synthetase class 2